ncbi:MAG: flotillin family protein [Planctomycetia bacterium]|nr:flotillin family protein [Planctomycetia bacterium]
MYYGMIGMTVALFILSMGVFIARRFVRCPSNRVLVKFGGKVGAGVSSKCIHGGYAFIVPIIQDFAFLHLEPIQIGIPLKDALSAENIRVEVPSVFTVAIGTQPEIMQNAAIRLLGLNTAQIKQQAEDIIFGQLRQVIASMRIEDINRDRESFLQNIQHSVEPELKKIGLVLINVNITDIRDESGYIKALGQKAASTALQQARGDVAEQEKSGEVRVAEAERDKFVLVASAQKSKEIGIREAKREQAVKVAQLDKEQQVGEQSAAFEKEMQVADADRAKRISIADANAKAFTGEAHSQAEVAAAQAGLQVRKAEAYQLAETKKREAEAAVLEAQNRAMAKAALADAERVEAERRAELEAPAKAQKAKTIVEAEADAQKLRIDAQAQAAAIFAKLEAEAKGQYEILAKKGEGLREIINACGGAQQAFQLLMLEHLDHLAETAAKAISNIKFDKVIVWENGSPGAQSGHSATSNFLQSFARTLPPMMQIMKDIGGVEVPEFVARLSPDGAAASHVAAHTNGADGATVAHASPSSDPPPTTRS